MPIIFSPNINMLTSTNVYVQTEIATELHQSPLSF